MAKAKRKYNPAKHLASLMRGCTIENDETDSFVTIRDRWGYILGPVAADAIKEKPWRWRIEITVYSSAGDLERVAPVEFTTEGTHRINDLTDLVREHRLAAVTELPPAFEVDRVRWRATVV